jgi:hypothetical protein
MFLELGGAKFLLAVSASFWLIINFWFRLLLGLRFLLLLLLFSFLFSLTEVNLSIDFGLLHVSDTLHKEVNLIVFTVQIIATQDFETLAFVEPHWVLVLNINLADNEINLCLIAKSIQKLVHLCANFHVLVGFGNNNAVHIHEVSVALSVMPAIVGRFVIAVGAKGEQKCNKLVFVFDYIRVSASLQEIFKLGGRSATDRINEFVVQLHTISQVGGAHFFDHCFELGSRLWLLLWLLLGLGHFRLSF